MFYIILILLVQIVFILYAYLRLKNEDEEYIFLKIILYSILGSFKLTINNFPIPVGFIIYLLFARPKINIKAKQISALLGLVIFFMGIAVPYLENIYFMRTQVIVTGTIDFNSMGISNKILYTQLKASNRSRITSFNESFNEDGVVQSRQIEIVDYNSKGFVKYVINFKKNEYLIKAQRLVDSPEYSTAISYDIFEKQIKQLTLTDVKTTKKFDYYYLSYLGKSFINTSTNKTITRLSNHTDTAKSTIRGLWIVTYAMLYTSPGRSEGVDSIYYMLMPL